MVEKVSDFKMPEKVVTRLLKDALPDNVIISKDAKNAACRSASIFILQLSIAAAEKAQMNSRRTLENQDVIKAVIDLGLGEYSAQLVRFGALTQESISKISERKRNAKRRESNVQKSRSNKKLHLEDAQDSENPHEQEGDDNNDNQSMDCDPASEQDKDLDAQTALSSQGEEDSESLQIDDEFN